MKSNRLSREELISESKRIYKNLSARISRLRELEGVPSYAIERFREIQEKYPSKYSEMSDKTLREMYRDLRYVDNLKSSRVEGAKSSAKTFEPIKDIIGELDESSQKKIWDLIGRITSDDILADKIKYQALYAAVDLFTGYVPSDEIIARLKDAYFRASKSDRNITEEDFIVRFTENIDDILEEYFGDIN